MLRASLLFLLALVLAVLALGTLWPLHGLEMRAEEWLAGWPWQRWKRRRAVRRARGLALVLLLLGSSAPLAAQIPAGLVDVVERAAAQRLAGEAPVSLTREDLEAIAAAVLRRELLEQAPDRLSPATWCSTKSCGAGAAYSLLRRPSVLRPGTWVRVDLLGGRSTSGGEDGQGETVAGAGLAWELRGYEEPDEGERAPVRLFAGLALLVPTDALRGLLAGVEDDEGAEEGLAGSAAPGRSWALAVYATGRW